MKIAIYMPNWIGDAIMATPALHAIRTQCSQAEIIAVLRPVIADVLAGTGLVDRSIIHQPGAKQSRQRGWNFVRQLRAEQFDLAVLLPNSIRSAWLAWISGAKQRIGFDRDGRGLLLTNRLQPKSKHQPNPVLNEYLRIAAALDCDISSQQMHLAVSAEDEMMLEDFWSRQPKGLRDTGYVCFNPGGAFGAAKHWPAASFAQLANRVVRIMNKTVLVLCGPNEKLIARKITEQADHRQVISFAEENVSVGLSKAAVKHSDLLITTDSGPRHFAPPFHIPVVTLFGPTHIAWSETHYSKAKHLQIPVDCGPCQQRICPLQHHRCMTELRVDDVFQAAWQLLQEYPPNTQVA